MLSASDLAGMQAVAEASMMDACKVLAYSTSSTDRYGNPAPTYTPGSEIACGFEPSSEEVHDSGQVAMTDGVLRLPIDTSIDRRDRIQVTTRYGVAVTAVTYEILGNPERGPSALVLQLREATE